MLLRLTVSWKARLQAQQVAGDPCPLSLLHLRLPVWLAHRLLLDKGHPSHLQEALAVWQGREALAYNP